MRLRSREVPVTSRRVAEAAKSASKVEPRANIWVRLTRAFPFGTTQTFVLAAVLVLLLLGIALPLRNYFQQRSEIANVQASIATKQQTRDSLQSDLDKYSSKAYMEEQARNRLGVVKKGETAFRIIDPAMTNETSVTTAEKPEGKSKPWYETVWNSITDPSVLQGLKDEEQEQETKNSTAELPIETTPPNQR